MDTKVQTIESGPEQHESEFGRVERIVDPSLYDLSRSIVDAFGPDEARKFFTAQRLAQLGIAEAEPAQPPTPNTLNYLHPDIVAKPDDTQSDYGMAG